MITKVKRNAQKVIGFIRPSHLEGAIQFRNQAILSINPFHRNSREKNYYSIEREVQVSELNKYIRKMERIYDFFPYFPLF